MLRRATVGIVLGLAIVLTGCDGDDAPRVGAAPTPGDSAPAGAVSPRPGASPPSVGLAGGETPEQTVRRFIDAESAGDEAAARALIWPDDNKYELDVASPLKTFQLISERRLDAAEAAESTATPPRQEGDVVVDAWVEYPDGRTSELSYFLREVDGRWRIYSLSFTL